MNTQSAASSGRRGTKESRVERVIQMLDALDYDPKRQKLLEFEKFYPSVLQAISRKVPRKSILRCLSDGGLKLYPALFEEFMVAMEKRAGEGSSVTCCSCGRPLVPNDAISGEAGDDAPSSSSGEQAGTDHTAEAAA